MNSFSFTYEKVDYTFFGDQEMPFMRNITRLNTFYEIQFLDYIKSLELEGSYIDGGCFVGNHTIFFANHCKSTHVYAIDPDLYFNHLWEKHCETNLINQNKVVFLHYALMEKEGYVQLNPAKKDPQMDCVDVKDIKVLDEGEIIATTLDTLFAHLDPKEKIAFIKLDIEGCELSALMGAIDLINIHKPVIAAEATTPQQRKDLEAFLGQFRYKVVKVFTTGIPMLVFRRPDED